jgi:hypothetical protein
MSRWRIGVSLLVLLLSAGAVAAAGDDEDARPWAGQANERPQKALRRVKCDPAASVNGPLICEDQRLVEMEERLQRLRLRAQQQGTPLTALGPEWEYARDNCADVECLRKVYREGLQAIRTDLLQGTKERFASGQFRPVEEDDGGEAGDTPSAAADVPAGAPRTVEVPPPAAAPRAEPRPAPRPVPVVVPAPVDDPFARLLPLLVLLTALLAGLAVWWRTRR